MRLSEFLIIYFACGSPLAVHLLIRIKELSSVSLARIVGAFILWPLFAARMLLSQAEPINIFVERDPLDDIREKIEHLALKNRSMCAHFEFREVFHRYTGLFEMSLSESRSDKHAALAKVLEVPASASTAACLVRINSAKIARHAEAARVELFDQISVFSAPPELADIAIAAMELIGDRKGIEILSEHAIEASQTPRRRVAAVVS